MKIYNKFPLFKKGNIITKRDLVLMRDNSLDILKLNYLEKNDGIINGLNFILKENGEKIIITKGIVKYGNEIYWLNNDICFERPLLENKYIVKIKFNRKVENRRYYIKEMDIIIQEGNEIGVDEIEVGRFISRTGAELRDNYNKFEDLRRDYNLIDIINTKYSSKNLRGTLHPKIIDLFIKNFCEKGKIQELDRYFIFLSKNGYIERESIIFYINEKLNLSSYEYTNDELYFKLLEILEKNENEEKILENKRKIPRKITVD